MYQASTAIIIAVVLSGALGWAVDAGIWRPLRRRGTGLVQLMILTIGLSLAGRFIFQFFIGGGTYQLPGSGGVKHQILGPIRLSTVDMLSMGISLVVLLAIGAVPVGGTPAQMGEFMKAQSARWARVVKEGNVKVE